MAGADAAEFVGREAENFRHPFQELRLAGMQHAIGLGDLEQPVENVFQHGGIADEQPRDLAGIMLEAGDVLARQVEDAPDIGFFFRRHAEDAAEDVELLPRSPRRRRAPSCRPAPRCAMVKVTPGSASRSRKKWPATAPTSGADGAADKQTRRRAADFAPDRHGLNLSCRGRAIANPA